MTTENETTRGQEPCPHRAAQELRSMLDVLLAAGTNDVPLYDDTLEDYAASMLEKVNVVCQWFDGGGVERIMGGKGAPKEPANGADSAEDEMHASEPFDVLSAIEDCSADLDSAGAVLQLAVGNIEPSEVDPRGFYVADREVQRIRDALNGIEARMIDARGRDGWRIEALQGGAA